MKYYLGLDIGTNSVGWAVTDPQYNILKLNNKYAYGARLFDDANGSKGTKERRNFRSQRRRKARTKWRIELLRSLFKEEIDKVDENFFIRLDNSNLYKEDKDPRIKDINTLFFDENFDDKEYHKLYPTIYHLRQKLMVENDIIDPRLVYLALEHIIKHRGHFLFENFVFQPGVEMDITGKICDLKIIIEEMFGPDYSDKILIDILIGILKSDETKNDKKRKIDNLFDDVDRKDSTKSTILNYLYLLLGSEVQINKLLTDDEDESEEKTKICFENEKFDEKFEDDRNNLKDKEVQLILLLKEIFDMNRVNKIIMNNTSLSAYMVEKYNRHKTQLRLLKNVIKKIGKEQYKKLFKGNGKGSYSAYIGKNVNKSIKIKIRKCQGEEFFKEVKKILSSSNDKDSNSLLTTIENGTFMPLQRMSDNGVIPKQLHEAELDAIINNCSKNFKFLNERNDDSNLTIAEKIKSIFNFRVPYYIGPLNNFHSMKGKTYNRKGAWVTFKSNKTKLYPWNYLDQIDEEKTAEDFIIRMTNKCTYLIDNDVMPRNSLLYQEYMVLNEINNLKINGKRISEEGKRIVFNLFRKKKVVKLKNISENLVENNIYDKDECSVDLITGINKSNDIVSQLTTYHMFKDYFGNDVNNDNIKYIIEKIVKYATIYNDGGAILKNRIEKECGKELKEYFKDDYDEKIKKISKLKFKGWGKFCREFLELEGTDYETGEKITIINALRNKSQNLMEIIETDAFDFKEIISKKRKKIIDDIKYDNVDEQYVSSSEKRAIWQTLKLVKEIRKISKDDPDKIFIEFARGSEKKEEKSSRKKQLENLYENIGKDYDDLKIKLGNETEDSLRRRDYYLYYTQLGRDMYTGERINIADLVNNNIYDKDHIYPKSKCGQDSIMKNLVLVNKNSNARKTDIYPLNSEIRKKMFPFWKMLCEKGLITKEKFYRLTRTTEFTDDEYASFIDRQLVETRQIIKVVKNLLCDLCPNSKIVCVKSELASTFRNGVRLDYQNKDILSNKIIKNRNLNDYHHAYDAYLNIVTGNVYRAKFTDNPKKWIKSDTLNRDYSLNTIYANDVYDSMTKEKIWISGKDGTIKTIYKMLNLDDKKIDYPLITIQQIENKGKFYDLQICSHDKNKLIPLKSNMSKLSNFSRYGGYSGETPIYFVIYMYDEITEKMDKKKGEIKQSIEKKYSFDSVPLWKIQKYREKKDKNNEEQFVREYFYEKLNGENDKKNIKYDNFEILINCIKKFTKLSINGFNYYITGNNENQIFMSPAEQLIFKDNYLSTLKIVNKFNDEIIKGKQVNIEDYKDGDKKIDANLLVKIYDEFIQILANDKYKKRSANQYKNLYDARDKFIELPANEKAKLICEILKLFNCKTALSADFTLIGKGKSCGGNLTLTKNLDLKRTSLILVYESITGLYSNEVNLNGLANS